MMDYSKQISDARDRFEHVKGELDKLKPRPGHETSPMRAFLDAVAKYEKMRPAWTVADVARAMKRSPGSLGALVFKLREEGAVELVRKVGALNVWRTVPGRFEEFGEKVE